MVELMLAMALFAMVLAWLGAGLALWSDLDEDALKTSETKRYLLSLVVCALCLWAWPFAWAGRCMAMYLARRP